MVLSYLHSYQTFTWTDALLVLSSGGKYRKKARVSNLITWHTKHEKDRNFSVCSCLTDDTIPERSYLDFVTWFLVLQASCAFATSTLCLPSSTRLSVLIVYFLILHKVDVILRLKFIWIYVFHSQVYNCTIPASVNTETNVTHADMLNMLICLTCWYA